MFEESSVLDVSLENISEICNLYVVRMLRVNIFIINLLIKYILCHFVKRDTLKVSKRDLQDYFWP